MTDDQELEELPLPHEFGPWRPPRVLLRDGRWYGLAVIDGKLDRCDHPHNGASWARKCADARTARALARQGLDQ
jgi:hypothetical protein